VVVIAIAGGVSASTSASADGSGAASTAGTPAAGSAVDESSFAASLYKIPQFASMGSVFRSSKPQALTESELEYLVDVVKHVFPQHVVFQFNIKNTVPEQVLLNVNVDVESPDESVWKKVSFTFWLPGWCPPVLTFVCVFALVFSAIGCEYSSASCECVITSCGVRCLQTER
jgi:hypothetical protein